MAKQSSKRSSKLNLKLVDSFREEQLASTQGPNQRKNFHVKDLTQISPKTDHQEDVFHLWNQEIDALAMIGSAGSGKSFLACYLALREVLDSSTPYDKLVIVRSTASNRTSGFLPGTLEEKLAPLEEPYIGIFDELFPWKKSYENLKKAGKVEFHSTEFLRGVSFNDAIVVVDEVQNLNFTELLTIATRVGINSRIIFCGDTRQNDLIHKKSDQSGLVDFMRVLDHMDEAGIVEFGVEDIVRSGFVKALLTQVYKLGL